MFIFLKFSNEYLKENYEMRGDETSNSLILVIMVIMKGITVPRARSPTEES